MKLRTLPLVAASLLGFAAAHAQDAAGSGVPGILNYQGRVTVQNVNFTGTGRFKFAFIDGTTLSPASTPLTLWSNDGSSFSGSEPQKAVELPVSTGLYSVTLGDAVLKNMAAIPAWVFQYPDVRLRVWFDDGVRGSQLLTPDQRIAAVGYALAAENANSAKTATAVANGAITAANLKTVGQAPAVGQLLAYTADGLGWVNGSSGSGGGGLSLPYSGTAAGSFGSSIFHVSATTPILGTAIEGESLHGAGIYGHSPNNEGVRGTSDGYHGVVGETTSANHSGVHGYTGASGSAGVEGLSAGNGPGVYAYNPLGGGVGLLVGSGKNDGIDATTAGANKSAVYAHTDTANAYGVYAYSTKFTGLAAKTDAADQTAGFFWNAAGGDALRTAGHAFVDGNLRATGDIIANGAGNQQAYLGGNSDGDVEFGSKNPAVTLAAFYNQASGKFLDTLARDATVRSLTITGGADLAEPFAMGDPGELPKGTVVVIDDRTPGQLRQSVREYDTGVAGIVSGANGIHPGISLKQEGVNESGQQVALTGRVYCRADARFGAIRPGDLLTTSATPGHAMRVSDPGRAQGAVLGKAMSPLLEGQGYVLVLVTLQ